MKVYELIQELKRCNPDEEIYIWRGNGNIYFDHTSNIKISRPYGNCSTNNGTVNHPLILSHSYEKDKKDENKIRKQV